MANIFKSLWSLFISDAEPRFEISRSHRDFLESTVGFYRGLSEQDKDKFAFRCTSFITATEIIGHQTEITDEDRLLVAAGSVILAWGFAEWHYVKVDTVFLVAKTIELDSHQEGFAIHGLVGTHHLRGKMVLSKPALHNGFSNDNDKRNVAIHEFSHLIDMADGETDGLPEQIAEQSFAIPWMDLVERSIQEIESKRSSIRQYGATNKAEFFAVASEYFFERPKMLKAKHPEVYHSLEEFYQQNRASAKKAAKVGRKDPCPCGSGKRYKRCCLQQEA